MQGAAAAKHLFPEPIPGPTVLLRPARRPDRLSIDGYQATASFDCLAAHFVNPGVLGNTEQPGIKTGANRELIKFLK